MSEVKLIQNVTPPGLNQILLVVANGERWIGLPIDRSYGEDGWDEPIRQALRIADAALSSDVQHEMEVTKEEDEPEKYIPLWKRLNEFPFSKPKSDG